MRLRQKASSMLIKKYLDQDSVKALDAYCSQDGHFYRQATGRNNWYFYLHEQADLPELFKEIRARITDTLRAGWKVQPILLDLLCELTDGGWVHAHTDATERGFQHIRYNILLSKPKEGGMLLHDGKRILMEEGDMYVLDTALRHGVTTMKGDKPYRLLSYGFLIPTS